MSGIIVGTPNAKGRVLKAEGKNISGVAIVCSVAVLILVQGGFYNLPVGVCGVLLGIFAFLCCLWKGRRSEGVSLVAALFLALALAYLVSAVANGPTFTMLSEAGVWAGVASAAVLSSCQTMDQRRVTLRWLTILGVITAVLGMAAYCGLLPMSGLMNLERLQFFFQYANTAGIWYAVVAVLCLFSDSERLRVCAPLPIVALLLTQSGGAVLVFAIFVVLYAIRRWRAGEYVPLLCFGVQGIVAIVLFALMVALPNPANALVIFMAAALCVALHKMEPRIAELGDPRRITQALIALVIVLAVLALILFSERAIDAATHFADRMVYVIDGIRLWATSPLLGVGPDNWQYLYPYMQSAQYHTTLVHNSYVQVAVDAGLVGLAILVAIFVLGLKVLFGKDGPACDKSAGVALALIAAHSLVDFDLQFGSIAVLVAFLASPPQAPRLPVKNLAAGIACAILCLPMSLACVTAEVAKLSANLAYLTGDHQAVQSAYHSSPLAEEDVSFQTMYLQALNTAGEYKLVEDHYMARGASSDEQAIYVSIALYNLGSPVEAGEVLIEHMELQPFNDEYLLSAKTVIDAFGLDESLVERYNAAVQRANDAVAALSSLIPEQRQLDIYLR